MLQTQSVAYADGETPLTGYLAWDDSVEESRPGLLLIHGGAGLDAHARRRADRFASAGYIVFACDMYGDGVAGNRERIMAAIGGLRANPQTLIARAQAGLAVLNGQAQVEGPTAIIGYCFGGYAALECARGGVDVAAVISVHGSFTTSLPDTKAIAPKILVCHGALDPHVPLKDMDAFIEAMNRVGADWQLNVYGGAQHGFTHEDADGRMPGVAYNASADARSTLAIENFLDEVFA